MAKEWRSEEGQNLESVEFTNIATVYLANIEVEYEVPEGGESGEVAFTYPPSISIAEGYTDPFLNITKIRISNSSLNPDAKIYYTTDGSVPTINSKLYEKEFEVFRSDVKPQFAIQAMAVESGKSPSSVVRREISVLETVKKPFAEMIDEGSALDGKLVMASKRSTLNTGHYGVIIEGCYKVLGSEMRYMYASDYEWAQIEGATKDFRVGNMLYTLNGEDFPESYYDNDFTGRHSYEKDDNFRYLDSQYGTVDLLGTFSYNNGLPECRVTGYRRYLAEATQGTVKYYAQGLLLEEPRPHVQRLDRALTKEDYSRHVVYPYTKVESNRIVLNDGSGATVQLYNKFEGHTLADLLPDGFRSGERYDVEGFVGYEVGVGLVLYPVAVYRCPLNPVVKAPNLLIGEFVEGAEEDGRNHSSDPYYTSPGLKIVSVDYVLPSGVDMTVALPDDPDVKVYYQTGSRITSPLYPYDDISARATLYEEGTTINCIYDDLEKNDRSRAWFVAERTDPATGIKSLSQVIELRFKRLVNIRDVQTIALFRAECYERENEAAVPVCRMTKGNLSDARFTVVRIEDKWLYVAQSFEHIGYDYMLIYNANGWSAAGLKPGDVVTDFAVKPMRTELGNWVGDATGFSRTFKIVGHADPAAITPQQLDISADSKRFDDSDLAHYFRMTNVKVERAGDEATGFVYTLRTDPPMEMYFDLFGFTGGWNTRYADENTPYEMTGVVVRKGSDSFAFCPLELPNRGENAERPSIYIGEDAKQTEFLTEAYLNFGIDGVDEIPSGTEIYYTLDGSNPFDNANHTRRRYNPSAPEKINSTVTVRAYSARRGTGVSAETQRVFTRVSRPVNFLANFIFDESDPDVVYYLDAEVTVLACSRNFLFVQGPLGNSLPIYNSAGWGEEENRPEPGSRLKGFVIKNANADNFRFADATGYDSYYTPVSVGAQVEPAEANALDKSQYGQLVVLRGVSIEPGSEADSGSRDSGYCSGVTAGGDMFRISHSAFGELPHLHGDTEGRLFDVTGIVMPSDDTPDAVPVLWIRDGEDVTPLESREPIIVCDAVKGVFYPETTVTIELPEDVDAQTTEIWYSRGMGDWQTCAAGEKIVIDRTCTVSAYIVEEGRVPGATASIDLTRMERSGSVALSAVHSENGMTVTVVPVNTPAGDYKIYYTLGTDTELTPESGTPYGEPVEITADAVVRAILVESGKAPGLEAVLVVTIPTRPEAQQASGRVKFIMGKNANGNPEVTIVPEDELAAGSYAIYYTLSSTLPLEEDEEMLYNSPIEVSESAVVRAMLVETGKTPGDECSAHVWVTTAIDGVTSDNDTGSVRVEGSRIIAPQGAVLYDLSGRRLDIRQELQRGVYIVVLDGGTSVKVAVR
ncbi:MAG: chitobiase/beta-hexosaminidase C-terminal domain-containing protein [Paramuribaculum sp.]|nr:chitobiase/beta-hexosaminidase C-terminal domain-containing protein [Paramuribaculum sp.]